MPVKLYLNKVRLTLSDGFACTFRSFGFATLGVDFYQIDLWVTHFVEIGI